MRLKLLAFSLAFSGALVSGAMASSAGRCGGTGGTTTKTITCPAGQYIVGIGARGGLFVDEFSVACQKIPVTGEPGPRGSFKSAGPGGGTFSDSGLCKKGDAMYIIWMNSGSLIDKVDEGWCIGREDNGWELDAPDFSKAKVDIGGPGGISCSIRCPEGEALYKVTVKYGGVIDSIRGECRQ